MTPAPERPDLRARIEALHPDGQPCVCVAAVLEMLDEVGPVGGSHWDSNGAAAPVTDAGLDVDKLAEAVNVHRHAAQGDWPCTGDCAREIAAEYAALSRQAEKETA